MRWVIPACLGFIAGVLTTAAFSIHFSESLGGRKPHQPPTTGIPEATKSQVSRERKEASPAEWPDATAGRDRLPGSENSADSTSKLRPSKSESEPLAIPRGISLTPRMEALHHRLEAENEDYAWSPYIEPRILAYFEQKRHVLRQFSDPTVVCRRTLCEIQLIGYGGQAFADWVKATVDYSKQLWFDDFSDPVVQVDRTDTGATAIIAILKRNPETSR